MQTTTSSSSPPIPPLLVAVPHPASLSLHNRIQTRKVTCLCSRSHVVVIGLDDGSVLVLCEEIKAPSDGGGGEEENTIRNITSKTPITAVDIAQDASVFAFASLDGMVTVKSVENLDDKHVAKFIHAIHHVVLYPISHNDYPFITDSPHGQVSITRRSWFVSRTKDLFKCEGKISSMAWHASSDLVAFCSRDGTCTVLSSTNSSMVWSMSDLVSSHTTSSVSWEDHDSLIVTCAFSLFILKFSAQQPEIILRLSFELPLLTAFSFGTRDGKIAVCFDSSDDDNNNNHMVALIERREPITVTARVDLPIQPTHWCCDPLNPSNFFFFVSTTTNTFFTLRSRTTDDVIHNLVSDAQFAKAIQVSKRAMNLGLTLDVSSTPKAIEAQWLDAATKTSDWVTAADLLPRVLDDLQWTRWVDMFREHGQLPLIAMKVPPNGTDMSLCETILTDLLENQSSGELYVSVLKRWVRGSDGLKQRVNVTQHIQLLLQRPVTGNTSPRTSPSLVGPSPSSPWWTVALAWWYGVMDQPQDAFWTVFDAGLGEEVFDLIDTFPSVKLQLRGATDKLGMLCEWNESRTISVLWSLVVQDHALGTLFVEKLFTQGAKLAGLRLLRKTLAIVDGLGDMYVERCAEYDSARLFEFLMDGGSKYSATKAELVCKRFGLLRERVFLLQRVGGTKEALSILLKQLRDVDACLALAQRDGYDNWDEIVEYCGGDAQLLDELLSRCLSHGLDPSRVVLGVRPGLTLKTWKLRLVELFDTLCTQRRTAQIVATFSKRDASESVRARFRQLKRGIKICGGDSSFCCICGFDLTGDVIGGDLVVFRGKGETYHQRCLLDAGQIVSRGHHVVVDGENNNGRLSTTTTTTTDDGLMVIADEDMSKMQALTYWAASAGKRR